MRVLTSLGVLLFTVSIEVVQGGDCFEYGDGAECSDEIAYEDVLNGAREGVCCKSGTEDLSGQIKKGLECRVTKCVPGSGKNICGSMGERYVSKERVVYDELLNERCTIDGQEGFIGLCCPTTSMETILSAAMGAESNEFPHQVRLKPHNCGGTVYNEKYILTAAHCVIEKGYMEPTEGFKVIVGTNIGDTDLKEFAYEVEEIIVHDGYSLLYGKPDLTAAHGKMFNDIALLKLKGKLDLTSKSSRVKALEIAPEGFDHSLYADRGALAGWGTTDTMKLSPHLQNAHLRFRTNEYCFGLDKVRKRHGPLAFYKEYAYQYVCVGGVIDEKFYGSAGQGDSGGPLICRGPNGHPNLCGIASFASGNQSKCVETRLEEDCLPNVFAKVAHFRDWIYKKTGTTGQAENTLYRPYLFGRDVQKGEFGHQVHITSKSGKNCGGTLIASDVLVTAAHCVATPGVDPDPEEISVGFKMSSLDDTSGDTYQVESIQILDGFKRIGKDGDSIAPDGRFLYKDNFYESDLAVIRLKQPVPTMSFPRLPVQQDNYTAGTELAFPTDTKYYKSLRARNFKILDKQECQHRLTRMARQQKISMKVSDAVLCGVNEYSGGSLCDRELGGGLICKGYDGADVLCGVQTFRRCMLSLPDAFVDLSFSENLAFVKNNI